MRYGAILADPPWRFETYSERGKGRSPEAHYDCMGLAEIKSLPVGDYADLHSCLFLWAINPMLPQALEVMRAWGLEASRRAYKTVAFNWVKVTRTGKEHVGLGYWTRANCELCLLGTRGHPKRLAKNVRQTVTERRFSGAAFAAPLCHLFLRLRDVNRRETRP